ncbi:hypothetical protein [Polynucleobacter sp.]|uniref:hypothetical protein n=1 Tax=Polynucleobacter sp. TaxID=2029855 RepID=UPI003015F38E
MKYKMCKKLMAVLVALCLGTLCHLSHAEADQPIPSPSATFTIDIKIYAFVTGQTANTSTGILTYQGKQYLFTVSGVGLGKNQIGASHLVGSGVVYNLNNLDDFEGSYDQISGGIMVAGHAKLISNKNVGIHLIGSTNGPVIISPGGVVIKFSK